jgi:preprotein translocase subunit YajC
MSFFISEAVADTGSVGAPPGGAFGQSFPLIMVFGMFAVMYFLIIRPQQKRQKELQSLLGALQKGDEVVFAGGLLGRISKLDDDYVVVEIKDGFEIKVQRASVTATLPKGTIKNI